MIDPKELRIGNLVMARGKFGEIVAVDEYTFSVRHAFSMPWHELPPIDKSATEPIPITPEWLEKLRFDMDDDMEEGIIWFLKVFDGITLRWNGFLELEIANQYLTTRFNLDHIKYINQLQNLFFALTGKELELKEKTHGHH